MVIGEMLGPYRVLEKLGEGGMGEVYKARDTRLSRDVAVKVLPAARSGTHDAEARFEREARAIAAVNHPNICAIYDVGNHQGRSYLVMELLEGETLDQRLRRGPLDVAPLVDHAIALADALETAHGRGLMHRDLKPANIFLTRRGQLKVLDFGLAKAVDAGDDVTRTAGITASGTAVGTLGYMSPEQLLGDDVDPRADVFSLGAVLYEMATGRRAFQGSTVALITDAILHHTPPALHAVRPELPEKLCDVIASALEKNRDERCPSAGDLRANLMRVKRQLAPATAPDVAPVRTSPSTAATALASDSAAAVAVPAKPLSLTLVATLVVAVSVLGGAAWWLRAPSMPPATTPAAAAGDAAAGAPTNSIAVLAFADMSEKKDQEYFSDGLAEELLNQLAKMPDLQVTARTSSFSFKGKADDIRDIAKKLNVAHVLEGSVRKSGNQLRITAQLIRADTGVHLWSETYDREMKDVFTVQDEIATMVATALKARIVPAQQANSGSRTKNIDAYVQYLLGRQAYDEFTDEGNRKAAAAYRQAIALDPSYGAAHSELAMTIFSQAMPTNDTVRFDEALATAEKAVALAPEGATYGVRGYLRFVVALDWTGAIEDFDKALALNPGDSVLQRRYSTFSSGLGRSREAFAAAKKAFELDPLSQTALILYGLGLINNGQLTEAEELLSRATTTVPGRLSYLSIAQRRQGRFADALATARRIPDDIVRLQHVAILEHSLGHERESQQALGALIAAHGQTAPFTVASVYAWRGETDQAFQWLERARKARDTQLPRSLRATDTVNSLRRDPRYAALEKAMKFPD